MAAIERRAPVIRSGGRPERDSLYVEDAVAAYLAICDLLDDGRGAGEAFNAGSGSPRAVLEVVQLVCKLAGTGVQPDVRGTGSPQGEISRQWLDYTKLRAASSWEPEVGLEEGLRRTIAWYREHLPARRAGTTQPQSARAPADNPG